MEWLWSTESIRALQRMATPALDVFMRGVSLLGSEYFYFAVLVALYWQGRRKLAIPLAFAVLFSLYVNFLLKAFSGVPRPWGANLRILETPEDLSFPSGHAQSVTTFFCTLTLLSRKPLSSALGAVLVPLVGISRVYLGVHYPGDVLFGTLFGAGFAFGSFRLFPVLVRKPLPFALLSLALPFFAPSPPALRASGALSGALFGYTLLGYIQPEEHPLSLQEYVWGAGTLLLLYLGGKMLPLPESGLLWVRYVLLTLYATFGYPALCQMVQRRSG